MIMPGKVCALVEDIHYSVMLVSYTEGQSKVEVIGDIGIYRSNPNMFRSN